MKEIQVNDKTNFAFHEEKGKLFLGEEEIQADFLKKEENNWHIIYKGKSFRVFVHKVNPEENEVILSVNGKRAKVKITNEIDALLKKMGMTGSGVKKARLINAPMPGMIYSLRVNEGDAVKKGDPVLILEAMKMENVIKSPTDGVIGKIHVKPGNSVEKGQLLLTFA